jgi:tetratricopeptide (TPR) repeat protein
LGNLHADVTGNTQEAERCYLAALELEPESLITRLNLAFLQRDLLLQFDVARETLAKVPAPADNSEHATWLLHEALFAAYSDDWDRLSEQLGLALARIPHGFPPLFFDDWMRASAVLVHLGFGARLLEWLTARGDCQRFRPWHEALRATELHWPEWLLRIAPEVRLPAEKIHAEIARRLARLPAASSSRPPPQPRHARRRRRG